MKTTNLTKIALSTLIALSLNVHANSQNERFPGDYFMVHKNMPHYMKVFRKYGDDKALGLNDEQKNTLQAMQEKTVMTVSQTATQIKDLELELQKKVVIEGKDAKQMKALVERIADLRMKLTMLHIDCIHNSKQILTPEQEVFYMKKLGIQK
ncbi:MAG: hypothetical protein U9N33_04845 [Campylobacterota bacterium]|nr:hypothetical protein [Campylobacterota bacterium]